MPQSDHENKSLVQVKERDRTTMEAILRRNIGMMHAQDGRYQEAMAEYQTALEIKKMFDETHREVAITLNAIGALLATKGESAPALAHFREALSIFRMNSVSGFTMGDDNVNMDMDEDVAQTKRNIELVENTFGGRDTGLRRGGRGRGTF
mmetsp:Transcript_15834/g.23169  ORF Transcript_15834/g.23169 Transcript_15834/m.23169 type:complete len:150 (+) Transcript_15834:1-450(+)